jgi:hypothetical protein
VATSSFPGCSPVRASPRQTTRPSQHSTSKRSLGQRFEAAFLRASSFLQSWQSPPESAGSGDTRSPASHGDMRSSGPPGRSWLAGREPAAEVSRRPSSTRIRARDGHPDRASARGGS